MKTLQNTVTGEHSCIMIKRLNNDSIVLNQQSTSVSGSWLDAFSFDFSRRLLNLLSFDFRKLKIDLAYDLITENTNTNTVTLANSSNNNNANNNANNTNKSNQITTLKELQLFLTKEDFKRLQKYSHGLLNANLILDLVPVISSLYFSKRITKSLSPEQAMILLGVGLQRKSLEEVEHELDGIKKERSRKQGKQGKNNYSNFGVDQTTVMGMFKKVVVKFTDFAKSLYEEDFRNSEENVFGGGNGSGNDLVLKGDSDMKVNIKDDMFGKDDDVRKAEKKVRTEYYAEKFAGLKRGNN